jgi:hypothetical protein
MAFGQDTNGEFNFQGIVTDDDVEPQDLKEDHYVNLLLYKENIWESKIAGFMRNLECKEL